MTYLLVLTLLLGKPENFMPVVHEIPFKTEKECLAAAKEAMIKTDIPIVEAFGQCKKILST